MEVEKAKLLLAIGNSEIEETICNMSNVEVVDSDGDIDVITDSLNYQEADFVIVNTILSEEKAIMLASKSKERDTKVIAIVESFDKKEYIAHMIGLGVKAFLLPNEIDLIASYIKNYPEQFSTSLLVTDKEKQVKLKAKNERIASTEISVKGKILIGVFNICHGAGATSTARIIAESLETNKIKTICCSMDGTNDFKYFNEGLKSDYIDIGGEENIDEETLLAMIYSDNKIDAIVFDFGTLFSINSEGKLGIAVNKLASKEFFRCTYKVGLRFSEKWNENKLEYFCENEIFKFDLESGNLSFIISGKNPEEIIEKYYKVDIYDRKDMNIFINDVLEHIGIVEVNQELQAEKNNGIFSRIIRRRRA